MRGRDGEGRADPAVYPLHDYTSFAPGTIMQFIRSDDIQRFTGSSTASWRPLSWMQNEGAVGVDLLTLDLFHVCKLNECPNSGATARGGNVSDRKVNQRNFSAKLSSTGAWQPRTWANLKTTVGADYTNTEADSLFAQGRGLAIGASTLGAASTFVAFSATQATAVNTLRHHAQEQLALRDRRSLAI